MRWVVRDGATALPGSCAWSGSSPGSAPNIERPPPTVVTADPSRLTDCGTSPFDAPIKSGSAMPLWSSPHCAWPLVNVAPHELLSSTPIAVLSSPAPLTDKSWAQHGLVPSMSRKANCYDNAFIESFFSSLKYELVYHHRFVTLAQARTAIFDYIETFYNRTRLHSSLDYHSPINFESKLN